MRDRSFALVFFLLISSGSLIPIAAQDPCAKERQLIKSLQAELQEAQNHLSDSTCKGPARTVCEFRIKNLQAQIQQAEAFIHGGCVVKPPPPKPVCPSADVDCDGVSNDTETTLLNRFRPYYRFSLSNGHAESARPADATQFVQRSDLMDHHSETDTPLISKAVLAADPLKVLFDLTDLSQTFMQTGYYLNVENSFRGGEPDWTKIENEGVGLYGHVAPLSATATDPAAFKIEYWQFYAFNPVPGQIDCYSISDAHEGDWEGVELVVESDLKTIRSTRHNIHSASAVFEMKKAKGPAVSLGGNIVEFRGPNEARWNISVISDGPLGTAKAQNNLVRFFCDSEGCTHPVVYIEYNGHASWPTEYWEWPGVLNHDGNDKAHTYLTNFVQNVGEVGNPTPNCVNCALVVGYNGHWGACGSDPPDGPPLKGTWGRP